MGTEDQLQPRLQNWIVAGVFRRAQARSPLHSHSGIRPVLGHRPVYQLECILPLEEPDLEVGSCVTGGVAQQASAPFDVEYAVGGCATYRGKDARACAIRAEVVPIGKDCVIEVLIG